MVSSATPAWKNAPEKSPRTMLLVFLRKPSVLSELERSAEAQIMLGTCSAKTPKQAADAARVAEPAFCSTLLQSTLGALPLNHSSIWAAFSGLALRHSASAALRSATIFFNSSARLA